jgi:hypothetical protein
MTLAPRRAFAIATAGGAALGVVGAAVVMTMAWQHNPQGEFREGGTIHSAWVELGLIYIVVGIGIGALVGALMAYLARHAAA